MTVVSQPPVAGSAARGYLTREESLRLQFLYNLLYTRRGAGLASAFWIDTAEGRLAREQGLAKARNAAERALSLDPRLVEAQFNRAIAHQQLREYAEAIADFQAYLAVGEHPYWRVHAELMIRELSEWVPNTEVDH